MSKLRKKTNKNFFSRIKCFFKNIEYLCKHKLSDINKNKEIVDISLISEVVAYKTKLTWNEIQLPVIKNNYETIKELLDTEKSFIRFGDGEIFLMDGKNNVFEEYNEDLSNRLKEIFFIDEPNCLTGITYEFYNPPIGLRSYAKKYIYNKVPRIFYKQVAKYYNYSKTYYSNFVSQVYANYEFYDFEKHFTMLRQLWENKTITVVTGDRVFANVQYNIFDNAKAVNYIYGPTTNAYSKYNELYKELQNVDKSEVLIFCLGPCGKVLAYDLFKLGYRCLDLGHSIKDYNTYKSQIKMTDKECIKFFAKD